MQVHMPANLPQTYALADADGAVLGMLGVHGGRLVSTAQDPDAAELVDTLNALKQQRLWHAASWESFLQAYARSEANEEHPIQVRGDHNPSAPLRVPEFQRRLRLIDMLADAGAPLHRKTILAQMMSEVLFMPPEDIQDGLKPPYATRLPAVPGLSGPTLSADVAEMRRMGLGFAPDAIGKKKQAFELDLSRLPLWVSEREAEALKVAVDLTRELNLPAGDALAAMLDRVSPELIGRLPDVAIDHVLASTNAAIDQEAFMALRAAIRRKKPMCIRYQGANAEAPKDYLLEHARLVWLDGSLYVLGHCPKERGANAVSKNREFRVDRFRRVDGKPCVKSLDGPASTPELPAFELVFLAAPDFAARFKDIPGMVRVGRPDPHGRSVVHIREHVPLRAVRRMLSYGQHAKLLGPDYVVGLYRETLSQMAAGLDPEND